MGRKSGSLQRYGIGLTVLRKLAKQIGKDHKLAKKLWGSKVYDARLTGFGETPDAAEILVFFTVLPAVVVYCTVLFRRIFRRNLIATIARFGLIFIGYTSVLVFVAISMSMMAMKAV